jgi:tetratricopeptide (TPR) repeat protein
MTAFLEVSDVRARAIEAEEQGRYVEAILLLEQCLRFDAADGYAWLVLSDAYKAIERTSDCADALRNALNYAPEPERWIVEVRLAMLAIKSGDFPQAEEWFLRACAAEGTLGQRWPLILRGSNLLAMEEFSRAEEVLRGAIEMEGERTEIDEAYRTFGLALTAQGCYEAALDAFRRAAEFDPDSTPNQEALTSLERIEEARAIAEELERRLSS